MTVGAFWAVTVEKLPIRIGTIRANGFFAIMTNRDGALVQNSPGSGISRIFGCRFVPRLSVKLEKVLRCFERPSAGSGGD